MCGLAEVQSGISYTHYGMRKIESHLLEYLDDFVEFARVGGSGTGRGRDVLGRVIGNEVMRRLD